MASHAGKWNSKRIQLVREIFDGYNDIIFVPTYKEDHANISLLGIDKGQPLSSPIQIARASLVINKQSKKTVNNIEHGVFSLSSYDEDMFYGISAILSSLGYSVYLPKLIEIKPQQKAWFPVMNGVNFKEFQPYTSFAEEKIVSIKDEYVSDFCNKRKQPEFAF